MKTLKAEEADGMAYVDLDDARRRIGRLHIPDCVRASLQEAERRKRETLTALSPY